ncbi:hypothetical protein DFH27DRAFT_526901 [Peziza echinospora]|nr:hypothetical protein DFH27DRAFT_526901 [Peziza echinospora]
MQLVIRQRTQIKSILQPICLLCAHSISSTTRQQRFLSLTATNSGPPARKGRARSRGGDAVKANGNGTANDSNAKTHTPGGGGGGGSSNTRKTNQTAKVILRPMGSSAGGSVRGRVAGQLTDYRSSEVEESKEDLITITSPPSSLSSTTPRNGIVPPQSQPQSQLHTSHPPREGSDGISGPGPPPPSSSSLLPKTHSQTPEQQHQQHHQHQKQIHGGDEPRETPMRRWAKKKRTPSSSPGVKFYAPPAKIIKYFALDEQGFTVPYIPEMYQSGEKKWGVDGDGNGNGMPCTSGGNVAERQPEPEAPHLPDLPVPRGDGEGFLEEEFDFMDMGQEELVDPIDAARAKTVRPDSFIPRVEMPIESVVRNAHARARALREWRELGIDLTYDESDWDNFKDTGAEDGGDGGLGRRSSPSSSSQASSTQLTNGNGNGNGNGGGNGSYISSTSSSNYPGQSSQTKPTRHLRLSNIGLTPLPSDLYRLIPDKHHIPQWRNEEARFVAFPARDPETMERLPHYHVLFPVEGPSEYFRGHFRGAVKEGDRYPAAVAAAAAETTNTTTGTGTSGTTTTSTSPSTSSGSGKSDNLSEDDGDGNPQQPMTSPNPYPPQQPRLTRPHQTIPLPGPPWPNSAYLPHTTITHGGLIYLHLLSTSIPPTAPGNAVLLSTSSQGGSTPETGKLPRTREILDRLLAEDYDLIGSHPGDSTRRGMGAGGGGGGGGTRIDFIPSATPVHPSTSGSLISHRIGNINPFTPYRLTPFDTEPVHVGASEEAYGILRIMLATGSRDDPFVMIANAAAAAGGAAVGGGNAVGGGGAAGRRSNSYKEEKRRRASEKRGVEGAEGRWLVRLASREEAWRLVRSWHMREFWTGRGGVMAEKVVMRAEIF